MKNILALIIVVFILSVFLGCATAPKGTPQVMGSLLITDISDGLPHEGLWRQNFALADMNGDGMLDIVTSPPRKAKEGQNRPFIFWWNPSEKKWTEGKFSFPERPYAYGGIAVGDINGDGLPDIALAQHGGGVVLFLNDKGDGFVESPLSVKEDFRSRALVLSDINGDGRLDLVAVSEAAFLGDYKPKGILVGISEKDGKWDMKVLPGGDGLYGDSVAVGDLRGGGNKDIAVAFLTGIKKDQKLIWLGDGKGNFRNYDGDLFGEGLMPLTVRTGDVDGDGKDEAVFALAEIGVGSSKTKGKFAVLKWNGDGFKDISSGLDPDYILAFDLTDIDGDGKAEIVAVTISGIYIYKYDGTIWTERGHYPLTLKDVQNVTDLRAGRNRDGSVLIVFTSGKYEAPDIIQGIKAYLLK